MTPGERIRRLREERDWTQKQLAERVGNIDHSGISNIELGNTPLGRRRAIRFADAFGVSQEEILPAEARPSLSTLDRRLQGIEETLAGARDDAARGREALLAALAANVIRLESIEATLDALVAQARATRT